MNKSVAIVAQRLLCDGEDIGDSVKMTIPDVEWKTITVENGSSIDVPLFGLTGPMEAAIDLRSVGAGNIPKLARPGTRKLEARTKAVVFATDGTLKNVERKYFLTAVSKNIPGSELEKGAASNASAKFTVLRTRLVEDGEEIYMVDAANGKVSVGGHDYSL